MAQSIVEIQRAEHSYLEALESQLTDFLVQSDSKLQRDRLTTQHKAANLLERIVDRSNSLSASYADPENVKATELDNLGAGGLPGAMTEFYNRLAKLKDHHRRYPEVAKMSAREAEQVDFAELEGAGIVDGRDFLDRMFTGEEALGRYLDLVGLHEQFVNLPPRRNRGMSYLDYLDRFDHFDAIPRQAKGDHYVKYLDNMLAYFEDYMRRAFPLYDLDADTTAAATAFAKKWDANEIPTWPAETAKEDGAAVASTTTATEEIWCDACQRTYAKRTVYDAHLTSKKHLKGAERLKSLTNGALQERSTPQPVASGSHAAAPRDKRQKERPIALTEFIIATLVSQPPLSETRKETKSNVERRQALTDQERLLEVEEMEERERKEAEEAAIKAEKRAKGGGDAGADEEEEEEERIYNPLKLPLGWDGKPIPYWLYKLHGLGVEYPCEICSGHIYMGRKNFERHFQESRHSFGMRALGLPNTKHFHEITRIEDAIALAEKLKTEGKQEQYRTEEMEELEDAEGNVFNRRTYEDLQKQGLL